MYRLSLGTLLLLPLLAPAQEQSQRPNVVILLADDLGYGDLGCFGHPTIQTPHLDKLAAEGLKLTQCYAAMPVCSPSRAGLLTGRNPNRLGIHDWIPSNSKIFLRNTGFAREYTIAELLRGSGYETGFVGKWHLNSRMDGSEPTPGEHGFNHWFATQNNAVPSHLNPVNFVRNGKPVGEIEGNSSEIIVDEALQFLKRVPKDKPYLLVVWFHAPHEPVAVTNADAQQYAAEPNADKRQYFGCVSRMDAAIGRLLDELDKRNERESTLVFFSSDNGPETLNRYKAANRSHGSSGGLRGMKLAVTEGGIRVPGIVRWPGKLKPGTVSATPITGLDIAPTLWTLSGRKGAMSDALTRFIDGEDASAFFQGKDWQRQKPIFWQYDKALGGYQIALRAGKWKLLTTKKFDTYALYDLDADPGEKDDRSKTEVQRTAELLAIAKERYADVNAGRIQ